MRRTIERLLDRWLAKMAPTATERWHGRLHVVLSLFLAAGLAALSCAELALRGPFDLRTILIVAQFSVVAIGLVFTWRTGRWRAVGAVTLATLLVTITVIDMHGPTNDAASAVALTVWVVATVLIHGPRVAWPCLGVALTTRVLGLGIPFSPFSVDDAVSLVGTGAAMLVLTGTVWAAEMARRQAQTAANQRTVAAEVSAEQARSLADAKSQFLAVMSHEIRTPINGVVNLTRLMEDTALDADQAVLLNTLQGSTECLVRVLNDILDFSKIEAGQLRFERVPVDLGSLVDSVTAAMRPAAEERGIVVNTQLDPALPRWVTGDPTRLRQVLSNLISNSVKFTFSGEIVVSANVLHDHSVRIAVRDTGIGFDPSAVPDLFSPFAQADSTTTRRFGGTGLGLAICRRLCEGMGGTIGVSSEPGVGSEFSAVLPLFSSDGPSLTDTDGDSAAYPWARVLIAEDNAVNQLVLERLLGRFGVRPAIVATGLQALDHVQNNPTDLVFMDLHMPVMDGLEATVEIRALGVDVPIVAVTASALATDRQRCLAAGMNAHISKPVDPIELERALAQWLREAHAERLRRSG